ncbi:hypothetical protein BDF14DRAFT_1719185, partial [Spinellus fusiger]
SVGETLRQLHIINKYNIKYSRRLNLIVTSEQDGRDIEHYSLEFKKFDMTYTTLLCQQSKNLRINTCILSKIHFLTPEKSISVVYLDFAG